MTVRSRFRRPQERTFSVNLTVHQLNSIPVIHRGLYVYWHSRRAHPTTGRTPAKHVEHGNVIRWNTTSVFTITIPSEPTDATILQKTPLLLQLRSEKKSKWTSSTTFTSEGRIELDLSEIASLGTVSKNYLVQESLLNTTLEVSVRVMHQSGDKIFRTHGSSVSDSIHNGTANEYSNDSNSTMNSNSNLNVIEQNNVNNSNINNNNINNNSSSNEILNTDMNNNNQNNSINNQSNAQITNASAFTSSTPPSTVATSSMGTATKNSKHLNNAMISNINDNNSTTINVFNDMISNSNIIAPSTPASSSLRADEIITAEHEDDRPATSLDETIKYTSMKRSLHLNSTSSNSVLNSYHASNSININGGTFIGGSVTSLPDSTTTAGSSSYTSFIKALENDAPSWSHSNNMDESAFCVIEKTIPAPEIVQKDVYERMFKRRLRDNWPTYVTSSKVDATAVVTEVYAAVCHADGVLTTPVKDFIMNDTSSLETIKMDDVFK